jgi:hypothetical protein
MVRSVSGFDLIHGEMDRLARHRWKRKEGRYGRHLPKLLALEELADLGSHRGELWVLRDNLVENDGIGHGGGHVLCTVETRVIESCFGTASRDVSRSDELDRMDHVGIVWLRPISVNGLKPAMLRPWPT